MFAGLPKRPNPPAWRTLEPEPFAKDAAAERLNRVRDEIREAGRKSGIARHNLLPQLDLVMGYSRSSSSDDFGQSMRFDEDTWSINLVSSTDWARTSEKAAFQQSLVSIKTARLSLEAREDEIKRDVRRQLEALLPSCSG